MQTCQGKTRTGAACRAPAGSGGLCFFHANPDSARSLGQIGGLKNRRSRVADLQVPDNMTAADLRNVTAQAIRLLLSGELRAREASALAQLCNSLYRVIQTADLDTRVARLEEQVAEEEGAAPPDGDPTGSHTNGTGGSGRTDEQLASEQRARLRLMLIGPLGRTQDMKPRAGATGLAKPRRHNSERKPRISPLRWLEAMRARRGTQAIRR